LPDRTHGVITQGTSGSGMSDEWGGVSGFGALLIHLAGHHPPAATMLEVDQHATLFVDLDDDGRPVAAAVAVHPDSLSFRHTSSLFGRLRLLFARGDRDRRQGETLASLSGRVALRLGAE